MIIAIVISYLVLGILVSQLAVSNHMMLLFFIGLVVVIIGISIYVLIERIKEIQTGEEDDLSNY